MLQWAILKMRVAVIGRTEILYETIKLFVENGYEIPIVITSKEAPEYRRSAKDFENLANAVGAKYLYTSKLDECKDEIAEASCDIAISLNYSSVISQEIIDLFPFSVLNAHGGDLPRYRGNACQAWAILNGESRIGLCIHSMIGGEIDSGDIIGRDYLDIDINTKVTRCWEWMGERIPLMFLDAVQKLQDNPSYKIEVQSKKPEDALRCYPRNPEDGKIDWQRSNVEILRLINASNKPYSGAYCFFENEKIVIWDAEIFEDDEVYLAECGQIAKVEIDGSIVVITGKGKIKIKEIECGAFLGEPGKKINSIRKRFK